MIGVIAKLENGEHLSAGDWKTLVSYEFNVSKTTAAEFVDILYQCKRREEFKRLFDPLKEDK